MSHAWEGITADIAKEARAKRKLDIPPPAPLKKIPRHSPLQDNRTRRMPRSTGTLQHHQSTSVMPGPPHSTMPTEEMLDNDVEALKRERDYLRSQLMDHSSDSSYRHRFDQLYRSHHSMPVEPAVSASVIKGVWDGEEVVDDGHSVLGLHKFRYDLSH